MTIPLPIIFDRFYPRLNKKGFTIDLDYEDHGLFYYKLDLLIDDRYAVKVSFHGELPKENSGISMAVVYKVITELVSLSGMVETPRLQAKTDIECRNATLQDRCSYKDRYEGTYNLDTEISEEGIKWRSSNESPGSIKADSI